MKQRVVLSLVIMWSIVPTSKYLNGGSFTPQSPTHKFNQLQPGQGCTVIYDTDGIQMLGGNNEDYSNPLTKVWFIPSEEGSYGKVYFGFDDFRAQGGMNDQGLFFDALALDEVYSIQTSGKQEYPGNLVDKIMSECATLNCVIWNFEMYYSIPYWTWQFFFGDASGESAIIEPQSIIRQQGGYQAVTNFLQSFTPPDQYTDPRYQKAVNNLEEITDLSVDAIRDILNDVHLEGESQTLYSNVYDLNNKVVYLYYFHNFGDMVLLNLEQELAQGYHTYDLPSLFPPNPEAETWAIPRLQQRDNVIKSRLDTDLSPDILQAYAGEYEMLQGWGEPDEALTVIAQDHSLLLRFPDYHQHELFPASPKDFYYVTFLESDYTIAYDVRFELDNEGKILYLELLMGDQAYRGNHLRLDAFVPLTPTPKPEISSTETKRPITATPTSIPDSPTPAALPDTATPKVLASAAPTMILSDATIETGSTASSILKSVDTRLIVAFLLIIVLVLFVLIVRHRHLHIPTQNKK